MKMGTEDKIKLKADIEWLERHKVHSWSEREYSSVENVCKAARGNLKDLRSFDVSKYAHCPDIGSLYIICELLEEMAENDKKTGYNSYGATMVFINSKYGKKP
jgi:hypothetical protein